MFFSFPSALTPFFRMRKHGPALRKRTELLPPSDLRRHCPPLFFETPFPLAGGTGASHPLAMMLFLRSRTSFIFFSPEIEHYLRRLVPPS